MDPAVKAHPKVLHPQLRAQVFLPPPTPRLLCPPTQGSVQRFRDGLVFKAHRLCASLKSRFESNKEEEEGPSCIVLLAQAVF